MADEKYRILGRVISRSSQQGVPNARVEAWDRDLLVDDLVGSAVTDANGVFQMEFDSSYFRELFADRQPDLFFKVFYEDKLVKSTEDSVLWNVDAGEKEIVLEVDVEVSRPESLPERDPLGPYLIQVEAEDKKRGELKLKRVGNPLAKGTLGDTGLAVEVGGREEFPLGILRMPFDTQNLAGLDVSTIRVFRF